MIRHHRPADSDVYWLTDVGTARAHRRWGPRCRISILGGLRLCYPRSPIRLGNLQALKADCRKMRTRSRSPNEIVKNAEPVQASPNSVLLSRRTKRAPCCFAKPTMCSVPPGPSPVSPSQSAMRVKFLGARHGSLLGIAGGANGGDILFLEACDELGIQTKMLLALPENQFIEASVDNEDKSWLRRFHTQLEKHPGAHVLAQSPQCFAEKPKVIALPPVRSACASHVADIGARRAPLRFRLNTSARLEYDADRSCCHPALPGSDFARRSLMAWPDVGTARASASIRRNQPADGDGSATTGPGHRGAHDKPLAGQCRVETRPCLVRWADRGASQPQGTNQRPVTL
jgi:hypothetical protein